MIIRKKPARQHGLHEPFRHENHARPVTRRELLGAGFLSGPAFVLAPAWLGALLKARRADATALAGIGCNALGTIQASGPSSRAAHTSPLRAGCPKAARSPSSNDGCAITTDS